MSLQPVSPNAQGLPGCFVLKLPPTETMLVETPLTLTVPTTCSSFGPVCAMCDA